MFSRIDRGLMADTSLSIVIFHPGFGEIWRPYFHHYRSTAFDWIHETLPLVSFKQQTKMNKIYLLPPRRKVRQDHQEIKS